MDFLIEILTSWLTWITVSFVIFIKLGGVPHIHSTYGAGRIKTIDPHNKTGKYAVIFYKCVRARYWFPPYVVGYYRWYWQANIISWCVFHLNHGDVNTVITDGKRVGFE